MRIDKDFIPQNSAWNKMMSFVTPQIEQRNTAQNEKTQAVQPKENSVSSAAVYEPSEESRLRQANAQRFATTNLPNGGGEAEEEVHDANDLDMEKALQVEGPKTLAAKKQEKFEEMDRLLALDPRELTEEELKSVREFLQSEDFTEYLARIEYSGDIIDFDMQGNVEKFAAQTARIKQNMDFYFDGEYKAGDVKERVEGKMEGAADDFAENLGDAFGEYTTQYNGGLNKGAFKDALADITQQRVAAYDHEYAVKRITNADNEASVRSIIQGRSAIQGSIFSDISTMHSELGEVTYKDIVEFTDFISDTERSLVDGRNQILLDAGFQIMDDGRVTALDETGAETVLIPDNSVAHKLGRLYGRHLFRAEQMAHNPFGENIYKTVEGRVESLIGEDLELLDSMQGKAVAQGDMTEKEAKAGRISFEYILKNAIAEISPRYKMEHADELEELRKLMESNNDLPFAGATISTGV